MSAPKASGAPVMQPVTDARDAHERQLDQYRSMAVQATGLAVDAQAYADKVIGHCDRALRHMESASVSLVALGAGIGLSLAVLLPGATGRIVGVALMVLLFAVAWLRRPRRRRA